MLSIERVVVFVLTPILAAGVTLLAKYGINLDPAGVDTVAGLGVASIGAAILKWLHGRQSPVLLAIAADAKREAAAAQKVDPNLKAQFETLEQRLLAKVTDNSSVPGVGEAGASDADEAASPPPVTPAPAPAAPDAPPTPPQP